MKVLWIQLDMIYGEKITCLLWMILNLLYFLCLQTHLHTGFLLEHSGIFIVMGKAKTLDTSMWNGPVGELS